MSGRPAPRIVVVQAEGPKGLERALAAVGVVPFWHHQGLHLAVVCKIALTTTGDEIGAQPFTSPARVVEPELSLDRPGRFPTDVADQLDYASDFVPRKPSCDVSVVGHARGAPGVDEVLFAVRILHPSGEPVLERNVAAVRSGSPLCAPHVGPVERPGPRPAKFREDDSDEVATFEDCASAPPPLRAPRGGVPPDARIEISGAGPGGTARVDLPGLVVAVTVDLFEGERTLTMLLDTIWLDLDSGRVELVHRGDVLLPGGDLAFVERIVVSIEHAASRRDPEWRQADTQRGTVGWAATEHDGGKQPPADPEDTTLTAARYRTWASVAPEPRMPLPTYTRIAAELAEQPSQRGDLLRRHDLTEDQWMVEERAWLERVAKESMAGEHALAAAYGTLLEEAQKALAAPEEADVTLRRYAEVRVALEGAADPSEVLEAAKWTVPRYARIEGRWLTAAEGDPAVASELEAHLRELVSEPIE